MLIKLFYLRFIFYIYLHTHVSVAFYLQKHVLRTGTDDPREFKPSHQCYLVFPAMRGLRQAPAHESRVYRGTTIRRVQARGARASRGIPFFGPARGRLFTQCNLTFLGFALNEKLLFPPGTIISSTCGGQVLINFSSELDSLFAVEAR